MMKKDKNASKDKPSGIERLRAQLRETREVARERGTESGRRWALDTASPAELARLGAAVGRRPTAYAAPA